MTTTFKAYSLLSSFSVLVILGILLLLCGFIFISFLFEKNNHLKEASISNLILLNISNLVMNTLIFYCIFNIQINDFVFLKIFLLIIIVMIILLLSLKHYYQLFMKNDLTYFRHFILVFLLCINIISNKIYIPSINILFAIISLLYFIINLKLLNDLKKEFSSKELLFYTLFNSISIFTLSFSLFYNFSNLIG